jgi:cobaltochelatase CobS subunit
MPAPILTDDEFLELARAAVRLPYDEQRRELRRLAMIRLKDYEAAHKGIIENIVAASPIVDFKGSGPNPLRQVAINSPISGFRDMLDNDTLIAITVIGTVAIHDALDAIAIPPKNSEASVKTVTGYAFGRSATKEGGERRLNARNAVMIPPGTTFTTTKGTTTAMATPTVPRAPALDLSKADVTDVIHAAGPFADHDAVVDALATIGVDARVAGTFLTLRKGGAGQSTLAAVALSPLQAQLKAAINDVLNPTTTKETEDMAKTTTTPATEAPITADVAAAVTAEVAALPAVPSEYQTAIDSLLTVAKLPRFDDIRKIVDQARSGEAILKGEVTSLRNKLASMMTASTPLAASGAIPAGKTVWKNAQDVFGKKSKQLDFDVPTFEWDSPHPAVPAFDADYVFRPHPLISLLKALVLNQQPWVHGHTGCGKSTLIEQIAARLNWPVMRVNFDSEVTRMDLMGRDTLETDPKTGQVVTRFVPGILPQAISGPYILLLDEIDFVRPDVSYVLQRALEGKGILLAEDGGRVITPHPFSRIMATANTVGQGDEFGMYQGARPQSMAFLDRFSPFVPIPYLARDEERDLMIKREPALPLPIAEKIATYLVEHRQAFTSGDIGQPLSPRGVNGLATQFVNFVGIYGKEDVALKRAFEDIVVGRANQTDGAVIKGIMNRVLK